MIKTEAQLAIESLGRCIADPMWADHAEVPKALLKQVHKALTDLLAAQQALPSIRVYPDYVKPVRVWWDAHAPDSPNGSSGAGSSGAVLNIVVAIVDTGSVEK